MADYRPENAAPQKIKKASDKLTISLTKNPDILAELGSRKTNQILVGFAAETQDLAKHALEKLHRKNLDMLVANDVTMTGAGFDADTNIVKLFFSDGTVEELPQMSKTELGGVLMERIFKLLPSS